MISGLTPRLRWAGPADLPLDRAEVLRYLGYRPGVTVSTPLAEQAVDEGMARAHRLLAPRAALVDCALEGGSPGAVRLVSGLAWQSGALLKLLRGARAVTLVAATVGQEVEAAVREAFAREDYALAAVMDAAGSAAVQAWVNLLRRQVGEQAGALGLEATVAYSPGYGDWDLHDQFGILSATAAHRIGLESTPTCFLVPQKSVVAVVGWVGEAARFPAGCSACTMRGCRFRREPLAAAGE